MTKLFNPVGALVLMLALFVGLFAAWRWTPLSAYVTPQTVIEWATSLRDIPGGPFIIMAAYTLATLTLFPRALLTLAAVVVFGPIEGFVYAMLGNVGASLLLYYAGRVMSRDTIRRFAGPRLNRLGREFRRRGLPSILAVRLVPVAPAAVIDMVAGAAHVRVSDYSVGTAIGMLPGTLVTTLLGDQLNAALRDPGGLNYGPAIVLVIALLLAVVALHWWWRKRLEPRL